jgi:hypothetical protein
MNDGGMGSLRFVGGVPESQKFGESIRQASFADEDGVPVSMSIFIDQQGRLYELDVFKADGSRLINFPNESELSLLGPLLLPHN